MADVPLGSATATITVSVSLDKSLPASVFGSVHTIGETNLGALYLTELGKLAFECAVPYSGTTSLQIESNGQGQVTVGGPITMSFVGEEGKARVTLLGLSVEGFTLEGELGGGIHSFLAAAGGFL